MGASPVLLPKCESKTKSNQTAPHKALQSRTQSREREQVLPHADTKHGINSFILSWGKKMDTICEADMLDLFPDMDYLAETNLSDLLGGIDPSSPQIEEYIHEIFDDEVFNKVPTTCTFGDKNEIQCEEITPVKKRPNRKRRGEKISRKSPQRKRSKKAPQSSTSPSDDILSYSRDFRLNSPATVSPVVHIPVTITTASLVPPGSPAMQLIHTLNPLSPLTYVLVSPQSLTAMPQVAPLSPAGGAVAPLELSIFTPPMSSLSERASGVCSPSLVIPATPATPFKDPSSVSPSKENERIPKNVETFIEGLKSHLGDVCSRMEGGLTIASHYIDTQLVKRKLVIRTGKNANKCLEKELVVLSDWERRRATVHRSHIFNSQKRLVTVLGKAGMGKSAFIQRMALDWCAGDHQQFQFVFLLNCRFLNLTQASYSLKSLLFQASVCPPCGEIDAIFKHILTFPERVLIVFDSFDNMKDLEGLLQSSATSASDSNYSVRQLFSGLFQKKILTGCTLLVATRPRDVLNQLLRKVDSILEVSFFSPENIEEYVSKYFKDSEQVKEALCKIMRQKYIFNICSKPLLCRLTCSLLERQDDGSFNMPSSLTELYGQLLSLGLTETNGANSSPKLMQLCSMAWEAHNTHNSLVANTNQDKDLLEYGLSNGILITATKPESVELCKNQVCFADHFLQNLLGALFLVYSSKINDKTLVAQAMFHQRKRKVLGEWQGVQQRFIMGLLFQKATLPCCNMLQDAADIQAKRKAVEVHMENLKPADLTSSRLMELFHCVYEAKNTKLTKLLLKSLPETLTFCGAQLSPVDVYVILNLLQNTKGLKRTFSIDLRDTAIPLSGLKELVVLDCITSFRVPIMDTINMWKELHQSKDESSLSSAIEKFTLNPIKVSQVCHVENLLELVQIHREKKLTSCEVEPALKNGVPAVRQLHKLEYEFGQQNGPQAFFKLTEILPELQSLHYLDLENNRIGDAGCEKLAAVLQSLPSLKMLNLSQNSIGDNGVQKLAEAMTSSSSLQSLSLYGNLIADSGAQSLASVLPLMTSLQDLDVKYNKFTDIGAKKLSAALKSSLCIKSLQMWNDCIPYGVFEHLQLQDSRIKAL